MSFKTLLGNWQEELAYEADKKKLQSHLRETGGLLSQQIVSKITHHTAPPALPAAASPAVDGFLRFNTPLTLQNAETLGLLSVDLDDRERGPLGWKIAATTSSPQTNSGVAAQLRNTWVLVPLPALEDAEWAARGEADVVHYGQKFLIRSVAALVEPPVFLASELKSPSACSKVTENQQVYFSDNGQSLGASWTVDFGNAEYREDVVGQPVKATSIVRLRHTTTSGSLASSSRARVSNDFGGEFEVCCGRFQQYASKAGRAPEMKQNFWLVRQLGAAAPAKAAEAEEAA